MLCLDNIKVEFESQGYKSTHLGISPDGTKTVKQRPTMSSDGCYYSDDGRKYVICADIAKDNYFQNGLRTGAFTLQQASTVDTKDEAGNPVERATVDSEPFSAYVFKTVVDPYSGTINIIKVNSGVLHAGDEVYVGKGTQRISMLYSMTGKKLDSITELGAGDIGAVTRLEGVSSTMTLSSPKAIIKYKPVKYPIKEKNHVSWYYAAKGLISSAGNAFLAYKGCSLSRAMFNHGMWG